MGRLLSETRKETSKEVLSWTSAHTVGLKSLNKDLGIQYGILADLQTRIPQVSLKCESDLVLKEYKEWLVQ